MTAAELLHAFVQHQAGLGRASRTLYGYRRDLGKAVALWGPDLDCQQITYRHCQSYRETNAHCAASTRSERTILLRQWLTWGVAEGHLWRNPAEELRDPVVRPATAWVPSEEQVSRLLLAPRRDTMGGLRDALVLELLYGTGLRRGELFALDLNDWHSERAGIWVAQGKGDRPRFQPVGEHLAELLQNYQKEVRPWLSRQDAEPALLLDSDGKRFPYYRLSLCLERYCKLAGVPTIAPHALRRAFATHLLLRGAELHEVQALLGHANPQVTQRYTKIEVVDLLREYRRTHPRANLHRLPGGPKPLVRKHQKPLPGLA